MISSERPSVSFWLVGLLGSALVVTYALIGGAGNLHIADLALFIAIVSAAIAYAVGGVLAKQLGGWQVICWALIIAFPFIAYPALQKMPASWAAIPSSAIWCFIYLALVSQLLGFFAWYKALAVGGVARVSQLQLLQPFVTILASGLFLRETITPTTIIFGILVVASVAIGKKMPIHHKL
jgi:drug/metabolite transporter (DMT)-like permease